MRSCFHQAILTPIGPSAAHPSRTREDSRLPLARRGGHDNHANTLFVADREGKPGAWRRLRSGGTRANTSEAQQLTSQHRERKPDRGRKNRNRLVHGLVRGPRVRLQARAENWRPPQEDDRVEYKFEDNDGMKYVAGPICLAASYTWRPVPCAAQSQSRPPEVR